LAEGISSNSLWVTPGGAFATPFSGWPLEKKSLPWICMRACQHQWSLPDTNSMHQNGMFTSIALFFVVTSEPAERKMSVAESRSNAKNGGSLTASRLDIPQFLLRIFPRRSVDMQTSRETQNIIGESKDDMFVCHSLPRCQVLQQDLASAKGTLLLLMANRGAS